MKLLQLFLIGACLPLFATDRPLPFFTRQDLTPFWDSGEPAKLGSFSVVNQDSQPITEKTVLGKPSLVNFFFCRCGSICPKMMHTIQQVQKKLKQKGRSIPIYSFSVTPAEDTPTVLKNFAQNHGLDLAAWTLMTGPQAEIYRIGKVVFKADRSVGDQKSENSFIHSTNLYLLDAQGRIRGIYDTEHSAQMALLEKDALKAL